jgi:hypothetical protein
VIMISQPDRRDRRDPDRALPSLDGATAWLNSPPLTAEGLRGQGRPRRVLDLHLHQLAAHPALRPRLGREVPGPGAGGDRRAHAGVPVRARPRQRPPRRRGRWESTIPVAVDNDYAIWRAFANHYWPALYFVDAEGIIRHHRFGEGDYERRSWSSSSCWPRPEPAASIRNRSRSEGQGAEAPPTGTTWSPGRTTSATSAPRTSPPRWRQCGRARVYASPGLRLNQWALSGDWTVEGQATVLNEAGGRIAYRFHARDLHLVMGPDITRGTSGALPRAHRRARRRARHTASTSTRRATARSTSSGSTS